MKVLVVHRADKLYQEFSGYCEKSTDHVFRNLIVEYAKDTNAARYGNFEKYVQRMEKDGPEWAQPDEEVLEKAADADIILTEWGAINSKVIDAGKKLKLIITIRSSVENISADYASEKGIKVVYCPSRLAEVVSDMTIAMMLSECRGIVRRNLIATGGQWIEEKYNDESHGALCNLKIGLLGYGGIAKAVARRLIHGFGCEQVSAFDSFVSEEDMKADGVKKSSLEEICRTCDIISLHLRYVPETENIIGVQQFDMMKPNAILINTARAGLVDENALIDALQKGKIRGAGLDVYKVEPLPLDSPLLKMDNVTLMPHSAGITNDLIKNSVKKAVELLRPILLEMGGLES